LLEAARTAAKNFFDDVPDSSPWEEC